MQRLRAALLVPESRKALGIDLGKRRIGIAVSDNSGTLASPRSTLERSGDVCEDLAQLALMAEELGVRTVVVGLPLGLDGKKGQAAREALAQCRQLAALLRSKRVRVVAHDERFSTVIAARALTETRKSSRSSRKSIDQSAAAVILQSWLDSVSSNAASSGVEPNVDEPANGSFPQ